MYKNFNLWLYFFFGVKKHVVNTCTFNLGLRNPKLSSGTRRTKIKSYISIPTLFTLLCYVNILQVYHLYVFVAIIVYISLWIVFCFIKAHALMKY